jgi:hypothetical protein
MARGDHISVARPGYSHHGIDVGDGSVVHFAGGLGKTKAEAEIRQDTTQEFLRGGIPIVVLHAGPVDAGETVRRALSRVGEQGYGLFDNNCEHFANWCVTGDHVSGQVLGGVTAAHLGVATYVASRAGISIIATNGSVPGLSGPQEKPWAEMRR